MSDPGTEFDPTADPVSVDTLPDSGWIRDQLARLNEIIEEKKVLEGEREAIQNELLPVLQKTGKPVLYVGRDGETHIAVPVAAERLSVDVDKLEDHIGPAALAMIAVQRKITRPAFERACELGIIPMEIASQVATVKVSKAYVDL